MAGKSSREDGTPWAPEAGTVTQQRYGRDPFLTGQQSGQFAQATDGFSSPSFMTALNNRFEGDAGGYSGRNDLLQKVQMGQLMGVQGRQQQGAQQARGIQAKQQQQATAQRNKQIQQRKTQQQAQEKKLRAESSRRKLESEAAKRIRSQSPNQLAKNPQFMQALALRLRKNPSLVPTPEPPAVAPSGNPLNPKSPDEVSAYEAALARQRASSGSHRNDSSPWYFM